MTDGSHDSTPERLYLTSALPYVNAQPHLGFAFELVLVDSIARFWRSRGWDVRTLTGTDDNSLKNVRAAEALGVPVGDLVDQNAQHFHRLGPALGAPFDDFIRTSGDPRHGPAVRELWRRCVERGDIYRRPYRGLYCVGCEQFYSAEELPGGLCPEHAVPPEIVEEENYFFRLSRYESVLRTKIESGRLRIEPRSRRNEVLALLRSGLEDFSVSRSADRARGWGIPVPGDPRQVVFVWFDALANYVSALGWPAHTDLFERFWRAGGRRTHVIGKGILRFHAVYWPAILLSAGLELPTEILTHGYVTVDRRKVGKSLGNAIDPFHLCERWGGDAVRYFLLRHLHTTKDSDYSEARLRAAYDADLANQLGNLLSRSVRLFEKHLTAADLKPGFCTLEPALAAEVAQAEQTIEAAFTAFAVHEAAGAAWRYVAALNAFVDRNAPWRLARRNEAERLRTVLLQLRQGLLVAARLVAPFVPTAAARLEDAVRVGRDAPALFPRRPPVPEGDTARAR